MILSPLAFLAFFAAAAMIAGCATAPAATPGENTAAAPPDFSIDLTVLDSGKPPAAGDARSPLPRPRNRRFVLFADGSLHYGEDPQLGASWLPELTRTLDRSQIDGLWELSRGLELADPSRADPLIDPDLIKPSRGRTLLLAMTGAGVRWNFVRTGPAGEPLDPAIDELAGRLAELAWATGEPEEGRIAPKRYDFGDDPYKDYRR